jgi:hypothetical protein
MAAAEGVTHVDELLGAAAVMRLSAFRWIIEEVTLDLLEPIAKVGVCTITMRGWSACQLCRRPVGARG